MALSASFDAVRQTLGITNFRNYMVGNFASQLAMWIQRVALQWLTWELTKDPKWLGIVAFADFFPNVILAPIAGALADRVDHLRTLRFYIGLSAGISAVIAILTLSGAMTIGLLVFLVLCNGIVMAFSYPVRLSMIPSLVERERLTSAIGVSSMGFNIARVSGPALAGLLIWIWGVGPAIVVTVLADIVFVVALFYVTIVSTERRRKSRPLDELPGEIIEGFRYAASHPGIAPLLAILISTSILARPFIDLLAGFSDNVFGQGSSGLAMLTAMIGIGAFAGSVAMASQSGIEGLTKRMIRMMLLLIVAVIGFAATDVFVIALACAVVAGYGVVTVGVTEQTLLQASVDSNMRGRVMSFYSLIARGCPAIGALLMGFLAAYLGLRLPVALGAMSCIGVWYWAYRNQDRLAAALEHQAPPGKSP
ncbi:MAG: hypothetical protein RLZ98_1013 [Pseudomonadota bacterium]|jgi:MFS family permease